MDTQISRPKYLPGTTLLGGFVTAVRNRSIPSTRRGPMPDCRYRRRPGLGLPLKRTNRARPGAYVSPNFIARWRVGTRWHMTRARAHRAFWRRRFTYLRRTKWARRSENDPLVARGTFATSMTSRVTRQGPPQASGSGMAQIGGIDECASRRQQHVPSDGPVPQASESRWGRQPFRVVKMVPSLFRP
jgi:hypothetical protein